ncbi:N-acetyl-1-D-myo-inositol-2-amino-2-deoxy-alpha-D-glucopyranoside deacetylase [Cryobacterium sp. CAN_C3]|uniref:PIG-L deacetylase family protein n=1 Tax=unclassified Cryobacterium TaxID=2649013 RepID=UPI0018C9DFCA|nr:PIG-L family deacetylase [Cryobacterium sp. CAN_C3]MEC5154703.1 N-acetyl-1-D-myo-inositol-2-amino-2-deoxy-alpha-D-glucopyranoside deacetylase [Cryobacterium sp. CAN_C3]
MSILDSVTSVLLVHAHPDDETISTGGLIAYLASRSIRVSLVTATRGERGEVVAGPLSALAGSPALAEEREGELERAAATLGVKAGFWLGETPARAPGLPPRRYRDSGMEWIRPGLAGPAPDSETDALARAPLAEVTNDLVAVLQHVQPNLVISYDAAGGYGHPDHVRVHDAALAASRTLTIPYAEILDTPTADAEWFDLKAQRDTVVTALRCHASQLSVDGEFIVHSGGQRDRIRTAIGIRLC